MPVLEQVFVHDFNRRLQAKAAEHKIPHTAMIEITYGCNLRCVHCFNPTHQALPSESKTQTLFHFLEQLAAMGCMAVSFTGGEIFTRPDVFEIFAYAKKLGFQINLLTNATLLTEEIIRKIELIAPTQVSVSVYGVTERTYESVTRVPGSFVKFRQGIELLKASTLPLHFKMPLMTLNRHELELAYEWFGKEKLPFIHSLEIHPRVDGNLEPLQYRVPAETAAELRLQYEEELGCTRKTDAYQNIRNTEKKVFSCSCGVSTLAITPYGEMNLCVSNPYPRYRLQTGSLREGWNLLVDFVAKSRPSGRFECHQCEVAGYCTQGAMDSFLETQDFNSCLPYFKQVASKIQESEISR